MDSATLSALVDEATKRAGVIWVRPVDTAERPRAMWHGWLGGVAYLVIGGAEQAAPDGLVAGARAAVTVPSKDKGCRLVTWVADVTAIRPDDERWAPVTGVLQAKRLNSADGQDAPSRWARESVVLALTPTGEEA